jgi:hypothetical protein
MNRTGLAQWLDAPPLGGWAALLCGILAVGFPTAIRATLEGVVTGCEFTPYLPFVLVAAVLLRWWQAGAVALASVAVLGGMFQGAALHVMPCFLSAAGIFLAASAMLIALVLLLRRAIALTLSRNSDEPGGGIRFSVDKGEVWASWNGQTRPVRLGSQRNVAATMKDFLAEDGRHKGGSGQVS